MAGIAKGKQKRKTFVLFYAPTGAVPEAIGKGIEEMGIEQSPNVESVNDVLGNTTTDLDAYEKTTELDPIYIEGGVLFSERLDEIEEKELVLDDVVDDFLWVKLYKTTADGKYVAWKQQAVIELTSFGGGTKGINAPATLHWIGERTLGTFDPATKTFTPGDGAAVAQLVTFTVDDGSKPVGGAKITINGVTLTTNANGIAETQLPTGSYPYTVTADGKTEKSGSVTVSAAPVLQDVTMTGAA